MSGGLVKRSGPFDLRLTGNWAGRPGTVKEDSRAEGINIEVAANSALNLILKLQATSHFIFRVPSLR